MNTETMRADCSPDDGWFAGAKAWTPAPDGDILRPIPELDLPSPIRYARTRNVRIWLWMHLAADRCPHG